MICLGEAFQNCEICTYRPVGDRTFDVSTHKTLLAAPLAAMAGLVDLCSLQLPCWAHIASFLELSDLTTCSRICAYFRLAVDDEVMWHRRWTCHSARLPFVRPPLGLDSWKEAAQHVELLRHPAVVSEINFGTTDSLLSNVTCALHADNGLRAYGYSDGTVQFLPGRLTDCSQSGTLFSLSSGSIRHMQLSDDGRTCYVGCWSGAVYALDLTTGTHSSIVSGRSGPVYAIRVVCDTLYTCCGDGGVNAWNATTGAALGRLEGHHVGVTDFCAILLPLPASSSKGLIAQEHVRLLISSSYDGTLRVWRALRHTTASTACASSIACASTPSRFDPPVYPSVLELPGHKGPVWTLAAQGTRIFSGSADGTVRVWELCAASVNPLLVTGRCVHVFRHTVAATAVCGPGGALLPVECASTGGDSSPEHTAADPIGVAVGDLCSAAALADHPNQVSISGLHCHKQVWCLKVVGPLLITGASDGLISCWDWTGSGKAKGRALLWAIAGPGCDNVTDGVRRLDIVKNTLYTTTRHGNIGVAALSDPGKGLPASVRPPAPVRPDAWRPDRDRARSVDTAVCTNTPAHSPSRSRCGPRVRGGVGGEKGVGMTCEEMAANEGHGGGEDESHHVLLACPVAVHPGCPVPVGMLRVSSLGAGIMSMGKEVNPHSIILEAESESDAKAREEGEASHRYHDVEGTLQALDLHPAGVRPPPSPVRVGSGPCSNLKACKHVA